AMMKGFAQTQSDAATVLRALLRQRHRKILTLLLGQRIQHLNGLSGLLKGVLSAIRIRGNSRQFLDLCLIQQAVFGFYALDLHGVERRIKLANDLLHRNSSTKSLARESSATACLT